LLTCMSFLPLLRLSLFSLFTYTTLFRSWDAAVALDERARRSGIVQPVLVQVNTSGDPAKAGQAPAGTAAFLERCAALGSIRVEGDRKSTRLNSSHVKISYAVFCLKKKKK